MPHILTDIGNRMQGFGGDGQLCALGLEQSPQTRSWIATDCSDAGFFQEYCAIKWQNAAHLPEGMDLANSAPLSCAGTTAFNAVTETLKELNRKATDTTWVAVVGCGGLYVRFLKKVLSFS